MAHHRPERVSALIQQEINKIMLQKFRFSESEFVTITRVDLSRDLRYAKVLFSFYGPPHKREKIADRLNKASGYFRHEIGRKVRLRYIPEIQFAYDKNIEYAARISEILERESHGGHGIHG